MKKLRQYKCLSVGNRLNKLWFIHTVKEPGTIFFLKMAVLTWKYPQDILKSEKIKSKHHARGYGPISHGLKNFEQIKQSLGASVSSLGENSSLFSSAGKLEGTMDVKLKFYIIHCLKFIHKEGEIALGHESSASCGISL